jgi:diguanylate cyclase (GGDEF)-like protein
MTSSYCLMGYPRAAYSIMLSGSSMIIIATAATGEPKLIGLAINVSIVSLLVIYMIARQYRQLRTSVDARKELIEQRQQAQMLAEHDQLTGLPNRRALLNELQARQKSHPMESISMAMLDLDGFKPVNDTFGHAAGDDLLIAIAERLRNTIGEQGLIARLGGDEFAILFNRSADLGLAYDLIEAARMEIMKPLTINSYPVSLGVSVGLVIKDEMPDDPLQLLQHADIALYDAKATHKSAICIFEQSMDEKVKRATIIEQSLADEVLLEGIEIVFQPIFEMQTGNHIGFEALARWEHPLLGRIYPNEFIAAAERCGWVRPLTHLLFEKALETAKLWDDYAILSFNLSGSGIGSSGFEKTIPEMLAKFDFPPQRLALEITETALLRDKMGARHVLQSLQSLGIRIVLDDFGAGYASIGYLRNFRFDGIKLDGSLIREICHNANARDLLNGVLHLCKAIGVSVTAEMVETEAQLALLRPLPIDNIQGYLLGEPVAAGDTFEPDSAKRAYRQQVLTASK